MDSNQKRETVETIYLLDHLSLALHAGVGGEGHEGLDVGGAGHNGADLDKVADVVRSQLLVGVSERDVWSSIGLRDHLHERERERERFLFYSSVRS